MADLSAVVAAVPGMPVLEPRLTLAASGLVLYGFETRSGDAVAWWRRLAAVSSRTGYQPIVVSPHEYEWLAANDAHGQPDTVDELLGRAEGIDGGALLRRWGGRYPVEVYEGDPADLNGFELARRGEWPDDPVRVSLDDLAADTWTGAGYDTSVLLVPAARPWQVPCVLQRGWRNGYLWADRHAAVLRYFGDVYGTRLHGMAHDGVDLAIGRPPADRSAALRAAWDYESYNDGAYDVYLYTNVTELAACLIGADLWECWWD